MKLIRRGFPLWSLVGLLVLVAVVGSNGSIVTQRRTIEVLINVVLVVGLFIFAGNSGVLSFGQMSFMAIGAYATALVTIPTIQRHVLLPNLPHWLATIELGPVEAALAAGLLAALVGAVIALPISRLSGLAASLAMFAVLVIVYQVAINWDAVTRGSRTMIGVPTPMTIWTALIWAAIATVAAYLHKLSATGLRLRASREDNFAARAAGIEIPRERWIAFVLSAFVIGIGGALYAQFQGAFTPSAFYLHITFITIAMLVFGGQKALAGAVIGAVAISVLGFIFNSIESGFTLGPISFGGRDGLSDLLLAAVILLVLRFRREGVTLGRELVLRRPGAGRQDHTEQKDADER